MPEIPIKNAPSVATGDREIRGNIGLFGRFCRILFCGWQILMILWFINYSVQATKILNAASTEAERAGSNIGFMFAVGTIVFFWLAGSVVFGLFVIFTRGPKMLVPLNDKVSS